MTDHSELKRLAEDCKSSSGIDLMGARVKFHAAANPAAVLALLAEVETLKSSHEQIFENYNKVSYASEKRGEERDQLRAENDSLRKDAERYRWLRSNKKWNDAADHVPWSEDVWILETRDDADNRSMDELDRSVDYLINNGAKT